jgi:hypothetical protein
MRPIEGDFHPSLHVTAEIKDAKKIKQMIPAAQPPKTLNFI